MHATMAPHPQKRNVPLFLLGGRFFGKPTKIKGIGALKKRERLISYLVYRTIGQQQSQRIKASGARSWKLTKTKNRAKNLSCCITADVYQSRTYRPCGIANTETYFLSFAFEKDPVWRREHEFDVGANLNGLRKVRTFAL